MSIRNSRSDSTSLPTLNQRGRTTTRLNEINERFVDMSKHARQPVLDIGCAFGIASIAALEVGARVIADDLDPRHIDALVAACPAEAKNRLEVRVARFPEELDFPESSLSVIHASNLLNFLPGKMIDEGFKRIRRWLELGGVFLSISGSPYASNIQGFIPIYEHRVRVGLRWPGECDDLHAISDHPTIGELPPFLHLLDPDVLARSAASAGLDVIEAQFFHRRGTPDYINWDGRENVVFVARKPL